MAELLSHLLLAYTLGTVVRWRVDWVTKHWVAVGMIGALLPDLSRISLFITDATIEAILGVPFNSGALHTLGGVSILAAIGAMTVSRKQPAVFTVLLVGGISHLLTDGLKQWADGAAGAWLYPVSWYRHPTPELYVSSDYRVLVVVGVVALAVALVDYLVFPGRQNNPDSRR